MIHTLGRIQRRARVKRGGDEEQLELVKVPIVNCTHPSELNYTEQAVLKEHNTLRAMHASTPAMCYSKLLESAAQAYVTTLAAQNTANTTTSTGLLTYDKNNTFFGENVCEVSNEMLTRRGSTWAMRKCIKTWYWDEEDLYNYWVPQLDFLEVFASFTQVVWRSSTKVGCSYAAGANKVYVSCRYFTMGNLIGDDADRLYIDNVMQRVDDDFDNGHEY